MTYEEWLVQVDRALMKKAGVMMDELPDWLSRDSFDMGLTPNEAADECLQQTGVYEDELVIDEL